MLKKIYVLEWKLFFLLFQLLYEWIILILKIPIYIIHQKKKKNEEKKSAGNTSEIF